MRRVMSALLFLGSVALVAEAQSPAASAGPEKARAGQAKTGQSVAEKMGDATRVAPARAASTAKGATTSATPQPQISFIDSPNVQCIQPDPRQDACFVNWGYSSVDGSPNYMIAMWISLNGKVVARLGGFFQTSMYASGLNLGPGFRVQCGPPVDDPADPATPKKQVGNSYAWDIKAKDSANLAAANYGTVVCPPYIP